MVNNMGHWGLRFVQRNSVNSWYLDTYAKNAIEEMLVRFKYRYVELWIGIFYIVIEIWISVSMSMSIYDAYTYIMVVEMSTLDVFLLHYDIICAM